jgi:hypothetical protein
MQFMCPRTHYDVVLDTRADFTRETAAIFAKFPESSFAYSQNDIDVGAFEKLAMAELVKTARLVTKEMPGYHDGMSDGEIMSRLDPEIGENLMGAMHLEHLCVGNFDRFGRRTFYVARELAEKFGKTVPSVSGEHVRCPSPCLQIVYDSQYMRDAVTAVSGSPSITEGTVSVYVMEHQVKEQFLIAITAFITNRRGIEAEAQRIVQLGGSGEHLVSELIEASLREDPMFPFKGDQGSQKAALARAVMNTLLFLGSKDADITPGLHPDLGKASPKERRRLEKTTTPLEYSLVGGWLAESGLTGGAWRENADSSIEFAT